MLGARVASLCTDIDGSKYMKAIDGIWYSHNVPIGALVQNFI